MWAYIIRISSVIHMQCFSIVAKHPLETHHNYIPSQFGLYCIQLHQWAGLDVLVTITGHTLIWLKLSPCNQYGGYDCNLSTACPIQLELRLMLHGKFHHDSAYNQGTTEGCAMPQCSFFFDNGMASIHNHGIQLKHFHPVLWRTLSVKISYKSELFDRHGSRIITHYCCKYTFLLLVKQSKEISFVSCNLWMSRWIVENGIYYYKATKFSRHSLQTNLFQEKVK